MDKKAKLFTKRIAERLFKEKLTRNNEHTKSLLSQSIDNVSKESLKKKLKDNFDLYLQYLNKCLTRYEERSHSKDSAAKLIQTWCECKNLQELEKEDHRQICVRVLLREVEHADRDLMQLVDQFQEQFETEGENTVPGWMDTTKLLLMSTTNQVVVTKLMLYYLLKLMPVSEEYLQSGKIQENVTAALKEFLIMSFLRFNKMKPTTSDSPPRRNDILASLLSIYIDLSLCQSSEKESDKKVSREVTSTTSYLLGNNWSLKLDVLNQVTSPVDSPSLLTFVRSCLEKVPDNLTDSATYLKVMMCLVKFKDHIEDIVQQSMKIRAPLGFIDWLTAKSPEAMADIPDDVRFKGRQITHFLLSSLSEELQSLLLDVLTDQEAAAYISAVNDGAVVADGGGEGVVETAPDQMFVMDRKGKRDKKIPNQTSKALTSPGKKMDVDVDDEDAVPNGAVPEEVEVVDLSNVLDAIYDSKSQEIMGTDHVSNSSQDSPRKKTLAKFKVPSGKMRRDSERKNRIPDDTIVLDTETSSEAEDSKNSLIPDILSHLRHKRENLDGAEGQVSFKSPKKGKKRSNISSEIVDITSEDDIKGINRSKSETIDLTNEEIVIDSDSMSSPHSQRVKESSPSKKAKTLRRRSEESVIMLDEATSPKSYRLSEQSLLEPLKESRQSDEKREKKSPKKKKRLSEKIHSENNDSSNAAIDMRNSVSPVKPSSQVEKSRQALSKSRTRRSLSNSVSESEQDCDKRSSDLERKTPRRSSRSVSESDEGTENKTRRSQQKPVIPSNDKGLAAADMSPKLSDKKSAESKLRTKLSQAKIQDDDDEEPLDRRSSRLSAKEMLKIAKDAQTMVNTESESSDSGLRRKRRPSKLDIEHSDQDEVPHKRGKSVYNGNNSNEILTSRTRSLVSETEEIISTKTRRVRRDSQSVHHSPSKHSGSNSTQDNSEVSNELKAKHTEKSTPGASFTPSKRGRKSGRTSAGTSAKATPVRVARTTRTSVSEAEDSEIFFTPAAESPSSPSKASLQEDLSRSSSETVDRYLEKSTVTTTLKSTPGKTLKSTPRKALKSTPGKALKSTPGKALKSTPGKVLKSTPGKALKSTPGKAALKTPPSKTWLKTPIGNSGSRTVPGKSVTKSPPQLKTEGGSPKTPRPNTRSFDSPMVTRSGKKLDTPIKQSRTRKPSCVACLENFIPSIQDDRDKVIITGTPRKQIVRSTPKRTPRKKEN